MKLTFVRHPESTANVQRLYGGKEDYDLSPFGYSSIKHIIQCVEQITDGNIQHIYSSPLNRCIQLASSLEKRHFTATLSIEPALSETHFGDFEGKTHEQLQENEYYKNWCKNPTTYIPPNGESLEQCVQRVQPFLEQLIEKNESCVIVTHGGMIRCCLIVLLGLQLDDFWRFQITNGGVVQIAYEHHYGYITQLHNPISTP